MLYLDNNATTPTDPRVVEAMLPWFYDQPGNAASRSHRLGWEAEEAVSRARQQLADLIGADEREIVFTSGATESDNLALKGVFELYGRKGKHVVTLQSEHSAVLDSCRAIEKRGGEVTYLSVNENGLVDLTELEAAIREDTVLVSIMWANNETGIIQPMAEIGALCEQKGVLLMSDATQAVGKIPVDVQAAGVHLLAFTAHKMYGPKGIGALYVRRRNPRVRLAAQIHGGGHQDGMRSGTLNVPAIVGFGRAAALAAEEMPAEAQRLAALRNRLDSALLQRLPAVLLNGSPGQRLPHVTNLSFTGIEGEPLMMSFNDRLAVSSGSACTSASLEPSHVLQAMGFSDQRGHSSLRLSLGRFNTEDEIEEAIDIICEKVEHLRSISPAWELFQDGV